MIVRYCVWSITAMPVKCVSGISHQKHTGTTQNSDPLSTHFTGWIWSEVMRIVFSSSNAAKTAVDVILLYLHQSKQEWNEEANWKKESQSSIHTASERYTSHIRVNTMANQAERCNEEFSTTPPAGIISEMRQLSWQDCEPIQFNRQSVSKPTNTTSIVPSPVYSID